MNEWIIAISIVVSVPAILIIFGLLKACYLQRPIHSCNCSDLISDAGFSPLCEANSSLITQPRKKPDLSALNCRAQLEKRGQDDSAYDVFNVEISGSIHVPDDVRYAVLRISVQDITNGITEAKPVHSRLRQWQMPGSSTFIYKTDLGKISSRNINLPDWTSVAQLRLDWLMFPRKGKRELQIQTLLLSRQDDRQLGCAECIVHYENTEFGYLDLQENLRRAKTLTVALAFAVSAVDGKLFNAEVKVIEDWATDNIDVEHSSHKSRQNLEKALSKTIAFFRNGNTLNIHKICTEIVQITSVGHRYDILELCLRVAGAKGRVTSEELILLKKLADWLKIDTDRFRNMMEKILPVCMHEVKDVELTIGVTSDMSREKARQQLNKEYAKWSSRVTNSDMETQAQADQMLELIAETRTKCIGLDISN